VSDINPAKYCAFSRPDGSPCGNMARTHDVEDLGHAFQPPAGEPAGPARRVRLTPASTIKPKPVRWLWEDRVPAGALTLIPGREGIGKSLTLVWLTASITRGTLPGIHQGTPRPVVYAANEDSWAHTVVPRLIAAGADLDMVYRVDVETELAAVAPLTLPRDNEALADNIKGMGVAMLALDPLMSVLASGIDTHRDRELRTALDPLSALADTTGCAVVGLAHFNKGGGNDALNLITGSRAFSAVARAVISIARDPEDDEGSCIMSQSKNNLGRLDLPHLRYVVQEATVDTDEGPAYVGRLTFTGESERGVSDIIGDTSDPDERSERAQAATWLREYIETQGESPAEDALKAGIAAGFSRDTLKRAKNKAGVVSRKGSFSTGWVWALADSQESTKGAKSA
jgi:AAA domain-containing protein